MGLYLKKISQNQADDDLPLSSPFLSLSRFEFKEELPSLGFISSLLPTASTFITEALCGLVLEFLSLIPLILKKKIKNLIFFYFV